MKERVAPFLQSQNFPLQMVLPPEVALDRYYDFPVAGFLPIRIESYSIRMYRPAFELIGSFCVIRDKLIIAHKCRIFRPLFRSFLSRSSRTSPVQEIIFDLLRKSSKERVSEGEDGDWLCAPCAKLVEDAKPFEKSPRYLPNLLTSSRSASDVSQSLFPKGVRKIDYEDHFVEYFGLKKNQVTLAGEDGNGGIMLIDLEPDEEDANDIDITVCPDCNEELATFFLPLHQKKLHSGQSLSNDRSEKKSI